LQNEIEYLPGLENGIGRNNNLAAFYKAVSGSIEREKNNADDLSMRWWISTFW